MPESPKFLLSMKKYDECRQVMSIIGRFNGKEHAFDGKFDVELQDPQHRVNHSEQLIATPGKEDAKKEEE